MLLYGFDVVSRCDNKTTSKTKTLRTTANVLGQVKLFKTHEAFSEFKSFKMKSSH